MAVLLPEQFGEEAMLVEVKFERILAGWLSNVPFNLWRLNQRYSLGHHSRYPVTSTSGFLKS
jgi:hypothetical protein